MEPANPAPILTAVLTTISAFIGALISHFLTQRRGLDLVIYRHREQVYKTLWNKLSLLPKWPKASGVTYEQVRNLSRELRDWYFASGGIYLSSPARKAYGDLQQLMNDSSLPSVSTPLSPSHYDLLQKRSSALRTELTADLLSRKRMFLVSR